MSYRFCGCLVTSRHRTGLHSPTIIQGKGKGKGKDKGKGKGKGKGKDKGKDKAVPLQAWSGPEGSGKLRFQDFVTTAKEAGKFVSFSHRPLLPPGNSPGTHFC